MQTFFIFVSEREKETIICFQHRRTNDGALSSFKIVLYDLKYISVNFVFIILPNSTENESPYLTAKITYL